jgi:ABC-type phosphate transport system substrate-binding protein
MLTRALVFLSSLSPWVAPRAPAPAVPAIYKIIVNASNPASALSRTEIASYFLKHQHRWPDGAPVAPVDQSATSPIRTAFSREILDKTADDVMHYWQQRIFSGTDTPPPVKSADEVIALVKSYPGGIGYVAADTPLPDGVKAVDVTGPKTKPSASP